METDRPKHQTLENLSIISHNYEPEHNGQHGMFPNISCVRTKLTQVAVTELKRGIRDVVLALQDTIDSIPNSGSEYVLDTVTFNLGLDSSGKLHLIAELGIQVTASINITLKRRSHQ